MNRGITIRRSLLLAAIVLGAWAGPAEAQLDASALDKVVTLMRTGDTQGALKRLKTHLRKPGLPKEQVARSYELMAYCYYALKRPDVAEKSFALLLKTDPTYRLDDRFASPQAIATFEGLRKTANPAAEVRVVHEPPTGFEKTAPLAFTASLDDADKQVRSIRLYYRKEGGSEFGRVDLKRGAGGDFAGTIPDAVLGPSPALFNLEYYLAAYDAGGKRIASAGGPGRLLVVPVDGRVSVAKDAPPVAEAESGGLLTKWWFWTGVGVAAAGVGVGTWYGIRAAAPTPATGAATVLLR